MLGLGLAHLGVSIWQWAVGQSTVRHGTTRFANVGCSTVGPKQAPAPLRKDFNKYRKKERHKASGKRNHR